MNSIISNDDDDDNSFMPGILSHFDISIASD